MALRSFVALQEAVVEQCQEAGLVWGRELYVDARHPCKLTPHATPSNRDLLSKPIWLISLSQKRTRSHLLQERSRSQSRLLLCRYPSCFQMKHGRNSL